jgi:nitrogen fixation protein FixH
MSNGKIWPYAIAISILIVFGFAVTTIIVTSTMPVEKSDEYMMYYQEADANANELIEARIAFDKKYKIEYLTDGISCDATNIKYKVTDLDSNPVDDAKIMVIVTRPNNHKHDQELKNPTSENGVYSFSTITLPEKGRWNIMAKVNVGKLQRFYNVKADTRAKEAFEY